VQVVWPWIVAAALVGVSFEMARYVVLGVRRHIYNRNRNRKYAEGKMAKGASEKPRRLRKNQRWRTTFRRRGRHGAPLPLPPHFAEDLRKQWGKVKVSFDEMLRFGEMVIELEEYVDNSFIYEGDVIVGRHPGMKGFLCEHCPHINYTTAIRLRGLALRAREVAKKGAFAKIYKDCGTAHILAGRLDAYLGVEYFRRNNLRRQRHRNVSGSSQFSISAIRDEARTALQRLDRPHRRHFVSALQELVREFTAS